MFYKQCIKATIFHSVELLGKYKQQLADIKNILSNNSYISPLKDLGKGQNECKFIFIIKKLRLTRFIINTYIPT